MMVFGDGDFVFVVVVVVVLFLFFVCLFLSFLPFLGLLPQHMAAPSLGGLIGAVATGPCQSHSNAVSATHTTAHGNTRSQTY